MEESLAVSIIRGGRVRSIEQKPKRKRSPHRGGGVAGMELPIFSEGGHQVTLVEKKIS
jgi:hypothetical protein